MEKCVCVCVCVCIGVDLFSTIGGMSEATERGEGVGAFSKIRVSKSHFKALKKRFSRELNVKYHGEELTKELFVEYRVKTIHFNTRSIALLARVLRMYIYMDLSKKIHVSITTLITAIIVSKLQKVALAIRNIHLTYNISHLHVSKGSN